MNTRARLKGVTAEGTSAAVWMNEMSQVRSFHVGLKISIYFETLMHFKRNHLIHCKYSGD